MIRSIPEEVSTVTGCAHICRNDARSNLPVTRGLWFGSQRRADTSYLVQPSSSVALGASRCAALPPVHWRRRVVNQTGDELQLRSAAIGPAELP